MEKQSSDFDMSAFISGLMDTILSGGVSYLNSYVKDSLVNTVVAPSPAGRNSSRPRLDDYIRDTLNLFFRQYINEFYNQTDTHPMELCTVEPTVGDSQENCKAKSDPVVDMCEITEPPYKEEREIEPESPSPLPSGSVKNERKTFDYPGMKTIDIQPEVIHTHSSLIIRARIPYGVDENDLRVGISESHAAINLGASRVRQLIQLPSDAIINDASAVVKDDILEVRIPKKQIRNLRKIYIDIL